MTVSTMNKVQDGWGERRAADRITRRRRRTNLIAVFAAIVGGAIPFLAGLIDGLAGRTIIGNPNPSWTLAIMGATLLFAAFIAARNWRDLDELEQRQRLVRLSLTGLTGLVALPFLSVAKHMGGVDDTGGVTWLLMIAVLIATIVYQRRNTRE